MINLINGDCLEEMKDIPDKSVNLVCIDPPYNIKKADWDKWKRPEDYYKFMKIFFIECQRLLKDNGSFYFFHNDFLKIVELQNIINDKTDFIFNSLIHWIKPNFRPLSWKQPSSKSNLRSWFNCVEYYLCYTFQDESGLSGIYANLELFKPIKDYLSLEKNRLGLSNADINALLEYSSSGGGFASHYFTETGKQWGFITKKHYEILRQKTKGFTRGYESLRQEYESLRQEYESLRYVHNLDDNHNNIWQSTEKN
ncbi:hypothetical protein EOM81_13295, partial [bacterium]|nr:hypothetical protein [bacterium]